MFFMVGMYSGFRWYSGGGILVVVICWIGVCRLNRMCL